MFQNINQYIYIYTNNIEQLGINHQHPTFQASSWASNQLSSRSQNNWLFEDVILNLLTRSTPKSPDLGLECSFLLVNSGLGQWFYDV